MAFDDYSSTIFTLGTLSVGSSKAGTIEAALDEDWFKITLIAGLTYQFDVLGSATGNGTLYDPYIEIYNSAGQLLIGDDDSGTGYNASLTYSPLASGTYYLSASDTVLTYTGTYTIKATQIVVDDYSATTSTSGSLTVGSTQSGTINAIADEDWFKITLTAGVTYRFDVLGADTGQGTLADPFLELYSSSGQYLAYDDDSGTGYNASLTYTPLTTGTYYLSASDADLTYTGTYTVSATQIASDDYSATTSTSGSLTVGSTQSGTINAIADEDWFKITLTAGVTYRFEVLGSDTSQGTLADPFLELYSSSGQYLAYDDDSGTGYNASLTFTPLTSGTYYLSASDADLSATGTYTIKATQIADDYAASVSTAGTLSVGGTSSGSIEAQADEDWFKITLIAGVTYRFEALGSDTGQGTLSDPYLEIYNSSGQYLAYDDDSGTGFNASLTFTALTSGTYYLSASDSELYSTGTYTISATPILDDYSATVSTSGALLVGGSATGTIDSAADEDWFKITLVAGQTYRFEMMGSETGQGTLADPYLEIYNSSGQFIAYDDDNGAGFDASLLFKPLTSGVYFLSASDAALINAGTYTIKATQIASDDYSANISTTGLITLGVTKTGSIETAGDEDWFKITLTAGTTYRLEALGSATSNGTLVNPYLELYNSAGQYLAYDDDFGTGLNASLTFKPLTSGTYYLSASDSALTSTGSYTLKATQIVDDFAAATTTTGSLTVGASKTGNIESPGDVDWFKVTLSQGTLYTIDLFGSPSGKGTLTDPKINGIFDSLGNLITGTQNDNFGTGLESRVNFSPSSSGTYYISASAAGEGVGTYSLQVKSNSVADLAANATTTASMTLGSAFKGRIDTASDVDWIKCTLTAGQSYVFELNSDISVANPLGDPNIVGLYGPNSALIAGTSNNNFGIDLGSRITFSPTTTGSYYLAVGGSAGTTGFYEAKLLNNGAASDLEAASTSTSKTLSIGTGLQGSIDFARDVDWFKVSLAGNTSYEITARGAASGSGTLIDPKIIGVYDSSGTIIFGSGNDNISGSKDALTVFSPLASGTYFVAVSASDDRMGTYSVAAKTMNVASDLPNNTTTTALLKPSAPISSFIDFAGDRDWIKIDLVAGTQYELNMLGSASGDGSLADPYIAGVYNPSGSVLQNSSDNDSGVGANAKLIFTATQTGQYIVEVGASGLGTGSYKMSIAASGSDLIAPTLIGTTPSDDMANVSPDANLTLQFSEAVREGAGNITISTAQSVVNISVNDTSQVSFNGSTMTINPTLDLSQGSAYSVTFGAGVVKDVAGNSFAGLTSPSQLNFTTAANPSGDIWTLMVYIAADNNLEDAAIGDLNEMESVNLPSSVNVVVLVDRTPGYDSSNGNWTDTRYGNISYDGGSSTVSSTLVSKGELNTGNSATLTNFINEAAAKNPAAHYGLIVWDHGSGLQGTAYDDSSNGDNLSLKEYLTALTSSNVSHFDFVGFDACLQGMVEQAWDVRNIADVLVASQQLEPGDGWEYDQFLAPLVNNPSLSSFQLANSAVTTYGNFYAYQPDTTLSAIKLSGLEALKSDINAFVNTAINAGSTVTNALKLAAGKATQIDLPYYRDLGDFMQEIKSALPGTAIATAADKVMLSLDNSVLSKTGTVTGVNGLSVYLPTSTIMSDYNMSEFSFLQETNWGNFLRFMLNDATANNLIGNQLDNDIRGFGGNDTIAGGSGADFIDGGAGNDRLAGDLGLDSLTGGAGSDIFVFNSTSETGNTATTCDVIIDFVRGTDKIDLSKIDANIVTAGDQAFSGTLLAATVNFSAAGQLKLVSGVLYGNTNADSVADFAIKLNGITTLAASDFIL